MNDSDILDRKIAQSGLTASFCRQAAKMGFTTLREIVKLTPAKLLNKCQPDYEWLGELSDYLLSKGLLKLLQPIPGRKYD